VDAPGMRTGHKAATANLARDESLRLQEFVGGRNCGPVQSKLASQFPSGWQPLTWRKLAGANLLCNLLKKLAIQRRIDPVVQLWPQVHPSQSYHIGWISIKKPMGPRMNAN